MAVTGKFHQEDKFLRLTKKFYHRYVRKTIALKLLPIFLPKKTMQVIKRINLNKPGTILKRHVKEIKFRKKIKENWGRNQVGDGTKLATKSVGIGDKNGRNWRLECRGLIY